MSAVTWRRAQTAALAAPAPRRSRLPDHCMHSSQTITRRPGHHGTPRPPRDTLARVYPHPRGT